MTLQYSLAVNNHSGQLQDVCIYQKPTDLGVPNTLSLAWLTAPCWPGGSVPFVWRLDYSLFLAQTGSLRPGAVVVAQQTVPADPEDVSANQILLGYGEGALDFQPGSATATLQPGSLYVRILSSVPTAMAAVGIGTEGAGVFAVQAEPNQNFVFTPHPEYWITAGNFLQGQVLDLEQVSNEARLGFEGTFAMEATLSASNTWTVSAA